MSAAPLPVPPLETRYLRDLGRAFAGALLFSIPLLMTMEMWRQGVAMDRGRLLLFVSAGLPLLYGLATYAGFDRRRGAVNDLLDTGAALLVGGLTAGLLLTLFGILDWRAPHDVVGILALQSIPAAMGALLARRQLSADGGEGGEETNAYGGELFLMAAGALFLALNIAPTEEMSVISYKTTTWHALVLMLVSIAVLHGLVFSAGFAGQEDADHPRRALLDFTLPGYGIALLVSLFVLFVFGRIEGHSLPGVLHTTVILGFPASIGAAAARLLV
ncbi:TIGR02587 family membrane protein [Brevundimonas sp. GCM10030266]|uniref:TIGR02587 family membrane protein n=1 Tax=Brevundimonas sp. GCM10030266 TaxID=3273386 RepID=UPI00361A9B90